MICCPYITNLSMRLLIRAPCLKPSVVVSYHRFFCLWYKEEVTRPITVVSVFQAAWENVFTLSYTNDFSSSQSVRLLL